MACGEELGWLDLETPLPPLPATAGCDVAVHGQYVKVPETGPV